MECLHYFLGFLLLAASMPLDAAKLLALKEGGVDKVVGSSPATTSLLVDTARRPQCGGRVSCSTGGRVQAVLTSDSPALVGSNITFVVNLVFPRCQKEDTDGNIVYEKNCRNETGLSADPYVYNWTAWSEDSDWENGTGQSHHNIFPDGKPFPHHPGWRRWNFVYVFHTLGRYFQKLGGCSVRVSMNTANVTLGPQLMEVAVYRRHRLAYVPIAQVKDVYVVTDQIPVFVTMSQKNDRNSSDETFLKDLPIMFDVLIHDPSHFLNYSTINYKWSFGDNTGLFVSMNNTVNHTYVLNGTFSLNLTVKAAAPGPCPPPPPRPPKPTPSSATTLKSYDSNTPGPAGDNSIELSQIPDENCQVNRYGHFHATITIVEGILEVNIIKMTDILMRAPQPDNSLIDLVVTCQGSLPTEVCTIISDPTCEVAQNTVCDAVDVDETCLLTVRRAFSGSGTYCVNLTLGDDTSLALTSTLISVPDRDPASPLRMANSALISVGCLAIFVTVISLLVYKKHKEYKPIENSPGNVVRSKGLSVFLNHAKAVFFRESQEKDPLLKNQEFKGVY
ncbi:transmembrane glycoprotein NMB [Cebus imitator]|uniref:transmembrane glycoprotein NMB n=1 Tax=Cebus imitator TaxID=2715852 RepID=UPI00189A2BCF|nr:transmembrane glycoprotein NMB [Cebus imitator]